MKLIIKNVISFLLLTIVFLALVLVFSPTVLMVLQPDFRDRQVVCQSNLKQLGLGFIQYSQDYDNRLPSGLTASDVGQSRRPGLGWAEQVYTYTKNKALFYCPDDKTASNSGQSYVDSYSYNENAPQLSSIANLTAPSHTVLLFEVSNAFSSITSLPTPQELADGPLSPVGDGTPVHLDNGVTPRQVLLATGNIGGRADGSLPPPRHVGGADYLFMDGHVKFSTPLRVSSGADAVKPCGQQDGYAIGHAAGTANTAFQATFSTN